jgi:hypothetical protein
MDMIFGKSLTKRERDDAFMREHHETNGSAQIYKRLLDEARLTRDMPQ